MGELLDSLVRFLRNSSERAVFAEHGKKRRLGMERGLVAVGGLVAALVAYSLGKRKRLYNKHHQVFVLAVSLRFNTVTDRDAFLAIWLPLANHVEQKEPETLGFEWLVADNDPTKVLVYERYTSKDAFLTVHRTSQPFLKFKTDQNHLPFEVEVSGQSYYETNQGFM